MDYSIVIPVFNREDLTRNCLATLLPTLEGAGEGEVLVVDNGSQPATAEVLAAFPWVRVIRNERNLGFAAACNQGTRAARGRFVVHLNNDTVAFAGWLARMLKRFDEGDVGVVGARLLFPDGRVQHAGVVLAPVRLGPEGFGPYHFLWQAPGDIRGAMTAADFEVVTGACLVTPRELFLDLGGFDETYWNGYEDVDFCLKVRTRNLRVVYEPSATLYHYESQSGVQRKRRLMHNVRELGARWAPSVVPDHNRYADRTGFIRRENFINRTRTFISLPIPSLTVFVHGAPPADANAFVRRIHGSGYKPSEIFWAVAGAAPAGVVPTAHSDVIAAARTQTEVRGDRVIAFVDTRTELEANWALELLDAVEFAQDVVAATVADVESDAAPLSADARCTLVALRNMPQHLRLESGFDSLDGAVADWIGRAVALGRSVRRTYRPTARIGAASIDSGFQRRYGHSIATFIAPDPVRLEDISRLRSAEPVFASIVMLSWNAPEYTELAVASIRKYTRTPYEIIIIDNGSDEATRKRIAAFPDDIRVIYNVSNMGFAHGCNQGMAAARGTHVVLLNNDVVVTEGWLEALIDAQRRDPTIGISAPRSNFVAGHQQVYNPNYANVEAMHEFAAQRRASLQGRTYYADRVIGFCMCIARSVIEEVGGIDTRYGVGNFEDDDYCIRVRAAGYQIVVCEDAFIHHFGSVTFKANNVDYGARMRANWLTFARRWDMPREFPTEGYQSLPVIARGFVRAEHHFALSPGEEAMFVAAEETRDYELVLFAIVANEGDWTKVAPVVTNFTRAYTAEDRVVFAIAAMDGLDAATLGHRVQRACVKAGLDPELVPDVEISDVDEPATWRAGFRGARCYEIAALTDRSRSGLARLLREHLSA